MTDIFINSLMIGSYRVLNSIKYLMLWLSIISFCLNLMADNLLLVNVLNWIGATSYFLYARLLFKKVAFDDFRPNYLTR